MLKFNNETTNKQISDKIRDHTKTFDLENLVKESKIDLFNAENAIRTLYFATVTGQNAILHGPGGYGKSKVIKWFYSKLGIPIFTKVCNSATTVEELLGIPNMKKLMEESTYEIAFNKTIFKNKGILFLEEGLDMQPEVAAALKDILTTKGYHQGNSVDPSFISSVVIATNKDPKECALDDSTAAFYEERFPHVLEIKWKTHEFKDYYNFLTHATTNFNLEDNTYKLLASVYEENKLSPRKCIYYTKLIVEVGIQYLTHIAELNTSSIDEMLLKGIEKKEIDNALATFKLIEKAIDDKDISFLKDLIISVKLLKCPEDLVDLREGWINKAKLTLNAYSTVS